jgi:hypothetical protein
MRLIILLMLILMSGIVYAEIQSLGTFKYNTTVELQQVCSNCSYVNVTKVIYPNSSIALDNNAMSKNGQVYTYNFSSTLGLGKYIVTTCGDIDSILTCVQYDFQVNNTGIEEKPSGLTILLMTILIILFIGSLVWAIHIEGRNKFGFTFDGKPILEINWGWHAKIFLFFISILFLWLITFISWQLSFQYSNNPMLPDFLRQIFVIFSIIIGPLFIVFVIIALIKIWMDMDMVKQVRRGLVPK